MLRNIFKAVMLLSCMQNALSEEKIVIIGAGTSGMAAATRLLENGIENILVLEAEQRFGGRVNTATIDGNKVDLGAQWCFGEKGNIIWEKLVELNLLDLIYDDTSSSQFYISSGTPLSHEISKEYLDIEEILSDEDYKEFTGKSLGEVLEKRYEEVTTQKFGNNSEKLKFARLAFEHFRRVVMCMDSCFSLYDSSATPSYEEEEGNHMLGWKNGYVTVFDLLTKKLPNPKEQLKMEDKILLNKEVAKIIYNQEDTGNTPIKIECSDQSSYTAKHVIVTPSLGVLKHLAQSFFEPKLSQSKFKAIKNIGYGAILKVFVSFKTKWWGNATSLDFVWTEEDKAQSRTKFPHSPTNKNGDSWIVEIYNVLCKAESNIVSVWFVGDIIPLIETMDEGVLKDGIYYTFELFMGKVYNITKPDKLLRPNWYTNPHFLGTYSYNSINSTADDMRVLQSPIENSKGEPLVQFAGEATNLKHYGTVQGAVESGYREADRLIKHYKKVV